MADTLPNELIKEILSPVFHVSDETLHDISDISPFFRLSYQPCSLALLVCKRWKSVGTPLLYDVVILRSKAQACALGVTLRENKDLGPLIRKLRVEGGYGVAMRTILTSSPNIIDISLSLDLRSSDSVKGLVDSLSSINPRRLTILDPQKKDTKLNVPLQRLTEELIACLKIWSNLRDVFLPNTPNRPPIPQICDALDHVPNIYSITIPGQVQPLFAARIEKFAKIQSLRRIWVNLLKNDDEAVEVVRILKSMYARINSHVVLPIRLPPMVEGPHLFLPSNPLYIPMEHASRDVYDSIWDRILRFAIDVDPRPHSFSKNGQESRRPNSKHTNISIVSKTFRRLSIPYMNRILHACEDRDLRQYVHSLKLDPSKGPQLQTIRFFPHLPHLMYAVNLGSITTILSQASNLTSISSLYYTASINRPGQYYSDAYLPMPWSDFEKLAQITGPNMVYLTDIMIPETKAIKSLALLSRFSALRELSIITKVKFDTKAPVSVDSLPSLEVLRLWDSDPSFLAVLSKLNLPALRELDILPRHYPHTTTKFLEAHGPKLLTLTLEHNDFIFYLCPNVTTLTLKRLQSPNDEYAIPRAENKHMHISKIVFSGKYYPEFDTASITDYSAFPALREIQIHDIGQWPSTEYLISKSPWPKYADVLSVHGIALSNSSGISWRPRLKYSRS